MGRFAWLVHVHVPRLACSGLVLHAAVVAAAGLVIGLAPPRAVAAHVLARGVAWATLWPSLGALVFSRELSLTSLTCTSWTQCDVLAGLALLAARPLLDAPEARGAFAPVACRGWFLAAAVGCAAVGTTDAWNVLPLGQVDVAWSLAGFALLAAAWAVARMRAWGVVLGAAASACFLAHAATESFFSGWSDGVVAIPGLMLPLLVLMARVVPRGLHECSPGVVAQPQA
jgi:hypothetical protein